MESKFLANLRQHMLNLLIGKMDEIFDSDMIMVVNDAFNKVLQSIENSNLNYQIQMTPFSAVISLKKSLVKNKCGTPRLLTTLKSDVKTSNMHKEELKVLKSEYDELYESAKESIEKLRADVKDREDAFNGLLSCNSSKTIQSRAEESYDTIETLENSASMENNLGIENQERIIPKGDISKLTDERSITIPKVP